MGLRPIVGKDSVTRNVESNTYREGIFDEAGPDFKHDIAYYNYEETPNPEAQRFYDMLKSIDIPSYEGCTKYSQLSAMAKPLVHEFRSSEEVDIDVKTYFEELQNNAIEIEWDLAEDSDEEIEEYNDNDSDT
ncbi:hypothetical protein M9H77_30514 [Catharanthus roseus]|uniref:Uncharacterized protein n=1 Tax=Catharanthus roseus TaxID=4058 RepID=A0ACC0A035_CATRO|nr:hypothetical protein M9H77_30514 [Catharanthus roseus]